MKKYIIKNKLGEVIQVIKTKPINKPKYTKFWVDFKNEWTKAKK